MKTSRHPIIDSFLNTTLTVKEAIDKNYNKGQYLERVLQRIGTEQYTKNANSEIYQDIDKAIISGHPDQNLYLLFLSISILYLRAYNELEKAKSLCAIADSLLEGEIEPMVKAYFYLVLAKVRQNEGKLDESMAIIHQSITIVNETEPRYYVLINNLWSFLGSQGRLKEIENFNVNQTSKATQNGKVTSQLLNSFVTGNFIAGEKYLEEYKSINKGKQGYPIEVFSNSLKILSGDFNHVNYQDDTFKTLADIYQQLSLAKFEEANKNLDILLKGNWPKSEIKNLIDCIPLHIEICLGNKGRANLILIDKNKSGNSHYIDDFFYGRLKLLEDDFNSANEYFTKLIENINRFGAMDRLKFELQFAKEMKLDYILQLLDGWPFSKELNIAGVKKNKTMKSEKLESGICLIKGLSQEIIHVKDLIKKYAPLKAPVLVTGETGTGKELVSKAIHDEGIYPKEPFLAINCGALTDSLLQSELFGYEAGAFTGAQKERKGIFEIAGKGTVFLDEFGEISPKLQVSLLRVLEANEIRLVGSSHTRKIECKIIIATNVDLHQAVIDKKFREDLYFRLARFEIKIPSLKNRRVDIPDLIDYFLKSFSNVSGKKKSISKELLYALVDYHWPGNIRELKNEMERLFILNPDFEEYGINHFDFSHLQAPPKKAEPLSDIMITQKPIDINLPTDDSELRIIQKGFPIDKRHAKLKELFKKYRKLTRSQIMEITQVGATTATNDLQKLLNIGFIIRRSPTKSTRTDYFELAE